MKAGRELDELVAEKVMEWRKVEFLRDMSDDTFKVHDNNGVTIIRSKYIEKFSPSDSIESAWQVLEKIAHADPTRSPEFELFVSDGYWQAQFFGKGYVGAETAPLAICLAALQYIGVEVTK